jgi:cysteine-rich repeat protein
MYYLGISKLKLLKLNLEKFIIKLKKYMKINRTILLAVLLTFAVTSTSFMLLTRTRLQNQATTTQNKSRIVNKNRTPETYLADTELPEVCRIVFSSFCGDGITEHPELCDYGFEDECNDMNRDGYNDDTGELCNGTPCTPDYNDSCIYCTELCDWAEVAGPDCGNGIVDGDEECDDGNNDDNDGCSAVCELPTCEEPCRDDAGYGCNDGYDCLGYQDDVSYGTCLTSECPVDRQVACACLPGLCVDLTTNNTNNMDEGQSYIFECQGQNAEIAQFRIYAFGQDPGDSDFEDSTPGDGFIWEYTVTQDPGADVSHVVECRVFTSWEGWTVWGQ